jgi:hypothetical protein
MTIDIVTIRCTDRMSGLLGLRTARLRSIVSYYGVESRALRRAGRRGGQAAQVTGMAQRQRRAAARPSPAWQASCLQ